MCGPTVLTESLPWAGTLAQGFSAQLLTAVTWAASHCASSQDPPGDSDGIGRGAVWASGPQDAPRCLVCGQVGNLCPRHAVVDERVLGSEMATMVL